MKLWQYPNINDVTTTPDDAPRFVTLARRDPDTFGARVKPLFGDPLQPLESELDADELFLRVENTAGKMGWSLVTIDREGRRLEAVATTSKLKFKDDIAIEVREADSKSHVHIRSRSRLGRKDFGVNERRIRAFLKKLQGEL